MEDNGVNFLLHLRAVKNHLLMHSIWLSLLLMMAFCFAIGIFVAAIIRAVARTAESLEFYNTHQEELKRLKKLQHIRRERNLKLTRKVFDEFSSKHGRTSKTGNQPEKSDKPDKYFARDSKGASDFTLMDYYYPSDEKITIIKKQGK